jgi:ABC-type branched-subunit amino acid transport system substrate-binding protein
MMKKIIYIILAIFLSGVLWAQEGQMTNMASEVRDQKFKIGILYFNSLAGERFRDGIKAAVADYSNKKLVGEPVEVSYDNETEGLTELVSLLNKKEVDILLGPTESGLFLRALEKRKELEKFEIPVISSQVAAKIPHQKGGWFFRTNINVERRAQVIYDFLNKYWVRSIAVLYQDDAFGRRAEEAFRKELNESQKSLYLPLEYDSTDTARNHIREILKQRPEAVGIFGKRKDFALILRLLKNLNSDLSPYLPRTFSVIDTRAIKDSLQDDESVYFVSVTGNDKGFDDVKALAYDTTLLIMHELETLAESEDFEYTNPTWRRTFRNRFESILSGAVELEQNIKDQSKTRLSFKDYENEAAPKVFRLSLTGGVTEAVKTGETFSLPEIVEDKIHFIFKRFGFWPVFNFFLIIFIVVFMSIKDLKRWYLGKTLRLFGSIYFWFLVLGNTAIALAAYFYLGETGGIRYDSILAAVALALGPSAILRVTLFETAAGKSIGLAKYYDNFLQWVYEKLTIKNYFRRQAYINVIAYHNSVYGMRCLIKEVYQNSPNKEQYVRMQTRVEEVLRDVYTWLDRRKALARLLLLKLGWGKLIKLNFVHHKFKDCDPETSVNNPEDPEEITLEVARLCATKPLQRILIDEKIEKGLKQLTPERQKELLANHEEDLNAMKTPTSRMRKKITFMFLLGGYDPDFRDNICCLDKTGRLLDEAVAFCTADDERKTKTLALIDETLTKFSENKKGDQQREYEKIFREELADMDKNPACLKKGIGFIYGLNGWDIDYLKANGLLPGDDSSPASD